MSSSAAQSFHESVAAVVRAGNCSGCGACAAISPTLTMQLDTDGYSVPVVGPGASPPPDGAVETFRAVCPGVAVRMPAVPDSGQTHPLFGPYVSSWQAWANDEETRWRGSSGGVLTALSAWLLETGRISGTLAAGGSARTPLRTVPVEIRSKADALAAAGSRYAPVSMVSAFDPAGSRNAFVGKPCEADAARRLVGRSAGEDAQPLIMSFFCAGVSSQLATDTLIEDLGVDPGDVSSLTYRGRGCPGDFVVTTPGGVQVRASYQRSWGAYLGRRLHDRCKICPDGTGMHADVTVGDFWPTDDAGYPRFDDRDGISVVIGRTARGHQLLLDARDAGVLSMAAIDLAAVEPVQPSQARRQRELPGRLAGRRLAGRAIPRMHGFALIRVALAHPLSNYRAAVGAYKRARHGS